MKYSSFNSLYFEYRKIYILCFLYIVTCYLNKGFKKFKKKVLKFTVEFVNKNHFNIDLDDILTVLGRNFDYLENEGVKFNFNDPVIVRIVKNDVELNIYRLNGGEKIDLLDFVHLNEFDDGKEIIHDLEKFKRVFDSEFYRKTLENILPTSNRGRPPFDVILMFEIAFLQILNNYTDNSTVKWIKTPPLRWFLDFPESLPLESTFWDYKEDLTDDFFINKIWETHQLQLDSYGFGFTEDYQKIAQDSKIITTNQGNYSSPRGDKAKTRRSRDGTSTKKGDDWYFGYKIHQVMDLDCQLIRAFEVTTASISDNQIGFDMEEKILYADKGYVGLKTNSYPAIMLKKSNDKLINELRKQRNRKISRQRVVVERPFAVEEYLGQDHVLTTTVPRTKLRMLIVCMIFNLKQVITLQKQLKERKKEKNDEKRSLVDFNSSADISTLNGETEKHLNYINNLKKRSEMSRKRRKIKSDDYIKFNHPKKSDGCVKSNFKSFTINRLDYTFHILQ